ncbi:MAG: protein kinase [Acidobacteria bacterium]|nr:protein kinase [Acidobacteriota bacterium]
MAETIGRYEIRAELGRGGFGRVYRAWDPTVGREVAIKRLTAGGDAELLQRFRNEAAAAGKLRHRNIIIIYDFGEQDGEPYIVMELLDGADLQRVMQSQASLKLLQKLQILEQVAEGLDHAHRNGVVHRDVKPANMMLLPDFTVKLMDFGIALVTQAAGARLTKTGTVPGTLKYMAPEQFRGANNDPLSDIFSFGVTAYEFICGRHPFEGPAQPAIMYNILSADPEPLHQLNPQCPEGLSHAIQRCLHKDREARYPSLDELLFDVRPVLAELRQEHARGVLGEAQRLSAAGMLEAAQAVLREVLELDPANRSARELREQLQTEIRRRVVAPKIDGLLVEARQKLDARKFTEAIEAVESALRLDRSSRDALELISKARSGKQQADHAEALVEQARAALLGNDLTSAYQLASEAMHHDPHHPDGARLIERVRENIALREHDRRCSEGIAAARAAFGGGAFEEAIAQLVRLQAEYPENREIPALLAEARAALAAKEREGRIVAELEVVQELIKSRQFEQAVARLETADRAFPNTTAILDLLSFAREESKARKRQDTIDRLLREVAQLEQASQFDKAVQMLERGLGYYPGDLLLERRLREVQSAREVWAREQQRGNAVAQANQMRAAGRHAEALELLRALGGDPSLDALHSEIEREWQTKKRADTVRTFAEEIDRLIAGGDFAGAVKVASKAVALYPDESLRQAAERAQQGLAARQQADARTEALRAGMAEARALLASQKTVDAVVVCEGLLRQFGKAGYPESEELNALLAKARQGLHTKSAVDAPSSELVRVKPPPWKWIGAGVLGLLIGAGYFATRKPETKVDAPVARQSVPPPEKKATPPQVTARQGTLIVTTGVGGADVYVDGARAGVSDAAGRLRLQMPAKEYSVRAQKQGFQTSETRSVTVTGNADAETRLLLNPEEATLILRGATPGAEVRIEGRTVGRVENDGSLSVGVPAGRYAIQISKDRFETRTLQKALTAGQKLQLGPGEVALTPKLDPQAVLAQEWERVRNTRDVAVLEDFARRNASSPMARTALDRVAELKWNAADKSTPAALRDFVAKNAGSPYAAPAAEMALKLEWESLDKNDLQALQGFAQRSGQTEYGARAKSELERIGQRQEASRKAAEAARANQFNAERAAIIQALQKFSSAIYKKDVNALISVFPSVNGPAWQRTFSEVKEMNVKLQQAGPLEINERSASVTCDRTVSTVARNGQARTLPSQRITIKLSKNANGWIIDAIN